MNENNELNNVEPTVENPVTPEVTEPATPEVTPELTQPEVPTTPEVTETPAPEVTEPAVPAEAPAPVETPAPVEEPAPAPVEETPVAPAETPADPTVAPVEPTATPEVAQQPAPVAGEPVAAPAPTEAPKKKVPVLVIIAVVMALLAAAYFLFFNKKDDEPVETPTENTSVENTTPVAEDASKYVGEYTADYAPGDPTDESTDFGYALHLRSEGVFSSVQTMEGDTTVGTYEVKGGKLYLNGAVEYGTDTCFYKNKTEVVLTINEDGSFTEEGTEKKLTYKKNDKLAPEDADTLKWAVLEPTDGVTPEGHSDPWKDCTNLESK